MGINLTDTSDTAHRESGACPALTPARYQPVTLDGASLTLAGLASIVAGAPAFVDPSALDRARLGQAGRRPGHRRAARLRAYDGSRCRPRGGHQRAGRPRPAAAARPRRRVGRAAAGGRRALRPGDPRQPAAGRRLGRHARPAPSRSPSWPAARRLTCRSSTGTAAWAPATSRPAPRSAWRCSASGPAPTAARRQRLQLTSADALPLMSSNAFTLAQAALGALALRELADAAEHGGLADLARACGATPSRWTRRWSGRPLSRRRAGRPGGARADPRAGRRSAVHPGLLRPADLAAGARAGAGRRRPAGLGGRGLGQHLLGEPALHARDGDHPGHGHPPRRLPRGVPGAGHRHDHAGAVPLGAGGAVADQPPADRPRPRAAAVPLRCDAGLLGGADRRSTSRGRRSR